MKEVKLIRKVLWWWVIVFFTQNVVAQDNLSMPEVYLKSFQKLRGSDFMEGYCIDRIFHDSKGRMWLQACGSTKNNYLINIVNYDGYSYTPYDLNLPKEHRLDKVQMTYLLEDDSFFGILNSPEGKASLIQKKIGHEGIEIYDSRFLKIENVIRENQNNFWISAIRDSFLVINNFNIKTKQWMALDSFSYNKLIPIQSLNPSFFGIKAVTFDDKLMLIGLTDNLYIFDKQKQQGQLFFQEQLASTIHFELKKRNSNIHSLTTSGKDIFVTKKGSTPPFFEWNAEINQFIPTEKFRKPHFGDNIFKDQQGNTLFTYKIGSNIKTHAYLVDPKGNVWDYSRILAQVEENRIYTISSNDFFKEAFIVNPRGLFKAEVQYDNQSNTYLNGQSLRWLAKIGANKLLVKRQSINPVILNLKTKEKQAFLLSNCSSNVFPEKREKDIRRIIKDSNGNSWFLLTDCIVSFPKEENSDCEIHYFVSDSDKARFSKDGNLYYVTHHDRQIFKYDFKLKKNLPCKIDGQKLKIGPRQINYILSDRKGRIWVATNHGFFKYDPYNDIFKHYGLTADFTDFRGLSLHEDTKGRIWIGTVKGGIQIFNPETEKLEKIIDNNNGLSNNAVVSIVEDKDGYHWVGTYDGLNVINERDEVQFRLFEEDGLPDNEFNRWSFCNFSDDQLFMGTVNGLFGFNPNLIKAQFAELVSNQIYVSQLGYYDPIQEQTVQHNYPDLRDVITLEADQRFLEIKAGMTNFAHAKENTYAYKIEGDKEDWITIGPQHKFSLSNLPSGKFTILLNGIDHLGNWAQAPVKIKVFAKIFFYQQTWFYLLCTLVIGGLIAWWVWYLRSEKSRLEKEVRFRTKQIADDKALIEEQAHQLLKVDEMKTNFFNNISHELRTPVTLIATPMQHLLDEHQEQLPKNVKQSLDLIHRNANKLGSLVEELLEISKLESGKEELYATPTDFFIFLEQIFLAHKAGAQLKKIDYQFDYQFDQNLVLSIDQKRLAKIIDNLLSNAIKFTPKEGKVHFVAYENEADWICMEVIDTGRGIIEEDLPNIFDRHFQSSKRSTPREGGVGIGLALAKELSILMRGNLEVESIFGKGSNFKLKIPKVIANEKEIDLVSIEVESITQEEVFISKQVQNDHLENILIVEDNPDMQQLLHSLLSVNYQCIIAKDGLEAWEWMNKKDEQIENIKLILSDIMMPRMDGYELLKKIKSTDRWKQIPTIMLTAKANETAKLKALRLGVDDYLTKPFSAEELKIRINNLLKNYQQKIEYQKEENIDIDFGSVDSADQLWLEELEKTALEALDKQIELNSIYLSNAMAISDRQLLRKIKPLTGLSIKQYIKEVKLQKARFLFENKVFYTINEVAYHSGFKASSYFTKIYYQRFGKKPADYFI